MQEEVTQKTIALSMKTGKLTAQALQAALKKYLQHRAKGPKLHHGKQSLKQLKAHGAALTNIEVTEANVGAFKPCAKKYGVDFTLRKDQDHPAAPLHRDLQGQGCRQSGTGVPGVHGQNAHQGAAAFYPQGAGSSQAESRPAAETRQRKNQAKGAGTMKPELKKLLLLNLPYLLFVYLFAKCGQAYRLAAGADASAKLLHLTNGISAAFANPLPSLHPFDLCVGVVGAVAVRLIVYSKGKNAKKYRKGEEYGSARWGTAKDIAPYIDPKFENNILLTQTERLTMTGRPKDPKTARNKNVLVIGGSGSGKTRFYVKPNLMQCFPTSDYPTSFVVTDPKGTLVLETGQMFQRAGYRVKILNTINFSKSMKYNPFVYIHSEKDVLKLVNTLIANTKGEGEKSAEDFWVKSERLFYTALIGYIWYEAPAEEMNFTTLLEMINASEAREDDPDFQSPVDLMFERLEQKDPDHFAVRQYKKFLLSAGKTRSSILISCGARLAPFDIREVRELMEDDEMELDTIGDEKTVLFLIMSDTDTTFNFILAMLQSQLINLLCDRADDKYGGRLPVHVRLILDEFANIGQIPNFDKLIATIRSREISASIILQSQSQLKAIYKDAAEIISDNCDSVLFLSGRGKNAKEISDALGKETIDSFNTSENRGSQTSHGLNYQKLGKALMSEDEIAIMDGGRCILQLRGVRPFFSEKFDITKHPHYKYLADADKKNTFDVDRFLSTLRRKRQQVVAQDEPFDLYEIDLSDEDAAE